MCLKGKQSRLGRIEVGENTVLSSVCCYIVHPWRNGHLEDMHTKGLSDRGNTFHCTKSTPLLHLAEVRKTQLSPPALATGRNCRNSCTLFSGAEYTGLNI